MKRALFLLSLILVFAGASVLFSQPTENMKACKDDSMKFCKDVKPGDGRITDCLKSHESELSTGCKGNMEKMTKVKEKMTEFQNACKDDEQKLCQGVKPGHGAIAKCLKLHESELSAPCKDEMSKVREKIQEFQTACKDDLQKVCKHIKIGKGRKLKCLKDHESELSEGCKAVLNK